MSNLSLAPIAVRISNEALILEKFSVSGVLERNELGGRECFFRA